MNFRKIFLTVFLGLLLLGFFTPAYSAKLTDKPAASSLNDADIIHVVQDVATTPVSKSSTWTLIKSFLKTYFDTLYDANNISNTDATDLTDGGDTTLHDHNGISENTTHRSSDGTDHTYIDQDVQTTASPIFSGLTVDTDTFYVDSTNNKVGIGNTDPAYTFEIRSSADDFTGINPHTLALQNPTGVSTITIKSFGSKNKLNAARNNGTISVLTKLLDGDDIFAFGGQGSYDGGFVAANRVEVLFKADGDWTAASNPTAVAFLTTPSGSTVKTERLRINSEGDVGIGTSSPVTKLEVDGAITQQELSSDPSDPAEGSFVTWMSDGTGSGDDGDIMMKITAGGVTKTTTLVDFSAL